MSWLSDLLGDITSGLIPEEISSLYTTPLTQLQSPDISFQPFTVTSGLGGVTAGPTGTAYTLSPQQQAIQDALMGSALGRFQNVPVGAEDLRMGGMQALRRGSALMDQGVFGAGMAEDAARRSYGLGEQFMGQAGMPTTDREAAVYERIRAAQRPEEERQRMALEERLFAQGRGGVTTSQYGGTPEQLAMAQAQTEAQNQAMLAAMQQAQREQAQQAEIGARYTGMGADLASQRQALAEARQAQALQAMEGGMGLLGGGLGLQEAQQALGIGALQAGYAPQAALLSALSPALNVAGMADVARRQQGEFDLETAMANLQGEMGLRTGYGSLFGGVYSGLLGGLGGLLTGSGNKPWWMP